MSNIYELALKQMETKDIDHHSSDLYLRKNVISDKLISEYEFKQNVTIFIDEIEHVQWYEIPFAYTGKQ